MNDKVDYKEIFDKYDIVTKNDRTVVYLKAASNFKLKYTNSYNIKTKQFSGIIIELTNNKCNLIFRPICLEARFSFRGAHIDSMIEYTIKSIMNVISKLESKDIDEYVVPTIEYLFIVNRCVNEISQNNSRAYNKVFLNETKPDIKRINKIHEILTR